MIAVLLNPNRPDHNNQMKGVQDAAQAMGQQIHILFASNESAINAAFQTVVKEGAGAMLVCGDPFFNSQR